VDPPAETPLMIKKAIPGLREQKKQIG